MSKGAGRRPKLIRPPTPPYSPSHLNSPCISSTACGHRWRFNRAAGLFFFFPRAQTNAVDILESGGGGLSALITLPFSPPLTPPHSPCPRGSSDFSSTLSGCFKKRRLGQRARPRRRVNFAAAAADRLCTCSSPTERVKCLLVLITAWENTTSHPLPGRRVSRLI